MRLKFKVIFIMGLLFFALVIGLAGWNLIQLRSEVELRKEAGILRSKLHDVLEALQAADTSFLLFKEVQDDRQYQEFVTSIRQAKEESNRLVLISKRGGMIRKDILHLKQMIDEKVALSKKLFVSKNSYEPKSIITLRDDLFLTNSISDAMDVIDRKIEDDVSKHQIFIERYFTLNVTMICLAVAITTLLFLAFAILVSQEISRRTRLESDLRLAQDAAINASHLKSQFLTTVSHEIRTPLNGIIGMSKLIQDLAQGDLRRFASIIHSSSQTLLRIVSDILDFSKIEANKLEFEIQEIQVSQLIESSLELFAARAQQKNILLLAEYDFELKNFFAADGFRIAQVLQNLIGNAIKFTLKGHIKVKGKVKNISDGLANIQILVEDTGIGIPKEKQQQLFQPFQQVSYQTEGTGLGLNISKRLVENMGGEIGYFSTESQGSTFFFSLNLRILKESIRSLPTFSHVVGLNLPWEVSETLRSYCVREGIKYSQELTEKNDLTLIVSSSKETLDSLKDKFKYLVHFSSLSSYLILSLPLTPDRIRKCFERLLHGEEETLPLSKEKNTSEGSILLVEDNETNQILAQAQLEHLGFKVDVVQNGKECLGAIQKTKYDLILMDCRMPEMDGFEATKLIREAETKSGSSKVPIIAMTANAGLGEKEKCLAAGMDDYIAKPFDIDHLYLLIREKTSLSKKEVDWSIVQELTLKTNKEVVRRMITSMIQSLTKGLEKIKSTIEENNLEELAKCIHQLKSSAAALGAKNFSRRCDLLEYEIENRNVLNKDMINHLLETGERLIEEYKTNLMVF